MQAIGEERQRSDISDSSLHEELASVEVDIDRSNAAGFNYHFVSRLNEFLGGS